MNTGTEQQRRKRLAVTRKRTEEWRAVDMRHAAWSAALALLACHANAPPPPPSAPSPLVGQPAPSIERRALDGSLVSSTALRGRPLLIEFFAEHCKPCMKSLPELE